MTDTAKLSTRCFTSASNALLVLGIASTSLILGLGKASAQSFECRALEFAELQSYETTDLSMLACEYEWNSKSGYELARLYTQPPEDFESASAALSQAAACREEKSRLMRILKSRGVATAACAPEGQRNDDPFKDTFKQ